MRMNKETMLQLFHHYGSIKALWQKSKLRHIHVAVVMKRGKLLEMASNYLGSRTSGCGYDNFSIHAERAVLKKVGDYTKLNGAILIVFRISRGKHELVESTPCETCRPHLEKCIKEYGLRRVYHS